MLPKFIRIPILGLISLSLLHASASINDIKIDSSKKNKNKNENKNVMSDHAVTVNTTVSSSCNLSNNDIEQISDFVIWPNPTNTHMCNIKFPDSFEDVEVTIISTTGQILKQTSISKDHQTIEFDDFSSGLYFLKFKSQKQEAQATIILY